MPSAFPPDSASTPDESSTSEAESSQEEDHDRDPRHRDHHGHHDRPPHPNGPGHQPSPPENSDHLSGLVCNVHRTTGRQPPPLVGATTTVLGDHLYVLGGRKLSRSRPQLTATLYQLDLIRRHWSRLSVRGDVPPPRYFHSTCPLGDHTLVCYGGMSPAPPQPDAPPKAVPEVIVMSDVHLFHIPSRTWSRLDVSDAPQGRYAHCAAVLPSSAVAASHPPSSPHSSSPGHHPDGAGGAEMVVVGGQDSENQYIEQVSVFNLRSRRWTATTHIGRSCGAYRSVVTPLTTMPASYLGAPDDEPHHHLEDEDEDDINGDAPPPSGAALLIYSNYNFLDVKLELQVRRPDGSLVEKQMQSAVSPPGLRFPNGGVIANHLVVSGTFLTSSKQEYALWALDLRTLTWGRIEGGGGVFSQGSWNRGVLWARRNAFVVLGDRSRQLVDDYNNRRCNFANICLLDLESFGLYDNPRRVAPTAAYHSVSAPEVPTTDLALTAGRPMALAAGQLSVMPGKMREWADMDFLAVDGTRIPVNSRLVARRWGPYFLRLLNDARPKSSSSASSPDSTAPHANGFADTDADADTATLRPTGAGPSTAMPSRASCATITPSLTSSNATTLTANSHHATLANNNDSHHHPSASSHPPTPPHLRPRLLYLPHTALTLRLLRHYLYTSHLPAAPLQALCSLLQLARPYRLDGLLEAVVARLHDTLDGRNAATAFNAAAMAAGGGDGVGWAGDGWSGVRAHRADDEDTDWEVWDGDMSAVVGLQKRGLRGMMEWRKMREREREREREVGRA